MRFQAFGARKESGKMKLSARTATWLLPLLLTGCFHRAHKTQNQPIAPPITAPPSVTPTPVEVSPSQTTIPPAPPPQPAQTAHAPVQPKPRKPVHRRRPAPAQAEKSKPTPTEMAANDTPGVSAIGQLSSGDPSDVRSQTEESIASIDKSLRSITRPLDNSEQKTADHIREFLKEAREALATGDVDGAHTLAAKAKVLLEELTK
jgi:hypothetical protein